MFRVNAEQGRSRLSRTMIVAITFLGLALIIGIIAGYQVWADHRLIERLLDRGGSVSTEEIGALRNKFGGWVVVPTLGAVFLLISGAAALFALSHRVKNRSIEHSNRAANEHANGAANDLSANANERGLASEPLREEWIAASTEHSRGVDVGRGMTTPDRARGVETPRGDLVVERSPRNGTGRAIGLVRPFDENGESLLTEERVHRMQRFIDLMGITASGLNHEIKNPLTALSLHVQLLEERIRDEAISADLSDLIGVVNAEILKLDSVLGRFCDLAHSGGIEPTPVDVVALAAETIKLIEPAAAKQKIEVVFHQPYENSLIVMLDHEIFKHALINMAIGALEAIPEGGELTFAAAVDGGELRFDVSDTGVSVPPAVRRELFRPYFTVLELGAGMGLARAEALIGRHGGRVEFKPSPSKTTFRLAIPLSPVVTSAVEKEALI